MGIFRVKTDKLSGKNLKELRKQSLHFYREIKKGSKRRTYIKSAYFKKEKIFIDAFWHHLYEKKNYWNKIRRLKYFPCAIELIQKSRIKPVSKINVDKKLEILHRFAGITSQNELFFVQIKENRKTGEKNLISIFPVKKAFREVVAYKLRAEDLA